MELSSALRACPIISILRGIRPHEAEPIGAALLEAGIRIAEVPLNSPEPLESIAVLAREFGEQMLVGAGTVTAPEQVRQIAAAGGELVVTPHADACIVRAAKQAGLIAIPGALSPAEVFTMHHAGADAIKLFPAEAMGTRLLTALLAVLPSTVRMIPVGGVDAHNALSWMKAGAAGVGVGSSIYQPGDTAFGMLQKARALVASLAKEREIAPSPQ